MKIKIHPGVAKDVAKIFIETTKHLNKVSPLPKEVQLHCTATYTVGVKDSTGFGFGVFSFDDSRVIIGIAGKYCRKMNLENGVSRAAWLEELPSIIAHEWVHMEQWRDGKPINHKGIDKRGSNLLKR
jgi:hypothetical protein